MTDHENIVKFLGLENVENRWNKKVLVMEYCSEGDLQHFIDSKPNGLTTDEFLCVFRDMIRAIKHLREKNILHRDVKPANILISKRENGKPIYKLADFGAARVLKSNECYSSLYGTYEYIHPDIFAKFYAHALHVMPPQTFTASHELWSIGVTFYELATGHLPFIPNEGRKDPKIIYKMTTQKQMGQISAKEVGDGQIEWSSELPNCEITLQNTHLKKALEPFLAGLLEATKENMWSFHQFFDEGDAILSKGVDTNNDLVKDFLPIPLQPKKKKKTKIPMKKQITLKKHQYIRYEWWRRMRQMRQMRQRKRTKRASTNSFISRVISKCDFIIIHLH